MNKYETKIVIRDGKETLQLKCPACGQWGSVDDDQKKGKISIECTCGNFHETIIL